MIRLQTNVTNTMKDLFKLNYRIKTASDSAVRNTCQFGVALIKEKTPRETGELMEAIVSSIEGEGIGMIVSATPASDLIDGGEDNGKPLAVLIDEGRVAELNWHGRTFPKTGIFGHVKTSVDPIRNRLTNEVHTKLKRVLN